MAAWYAQQEHAAKQALLLRLRANEGADATTGRNYRIWRRYEEGKRDLARLGKEFGISGHRAGADRRPAARNSAVAAEDLVGKPAATSAGRSTSTPNREDYRGKWLYD